MAFKVWILNKNTSAKQVIVYGDANYKFSKEESDLIGDAPIKHSTMQIHKDDSIEQLKKKIVTETNANYAEIYAFCYKYTKLNLLQALLSSTKSIIDKPTLQTFLKNLDIDKEIQESKSVYEYNYLVSLGFNHEYSMNIKTSLGIEFKRQPNYMFSPNPFIKGIQDADVQNSLVMNESRLIGEVHDNNIYICFANDIDELDESTVRVYYPLLANDNIFNAIDLKNNQELLMKNTAKIMENTEYSNAVDIMYSLYYNKDRDLGASKGITQININIVPPFDMVMPLEALFKNIHCDASYPFIKYNPGVRRENLYRLYSIQVSKTGKKIPFLSPNKLTSLARITSTHKQISVFNAPNNLIITIDANGTVGIEGKFKDAKPIGEIEQFLKSAVNPVIDKVNNYLLSSGYRISYMDRIHDNNIKISNMNYQFVCPLSKRVQLRNACVYSVFDVLETDIRKGGLLRFKRVDNFQKMDGLNAFIYEYFKKRNDPSDAVDALVKNYNVDTKRAIELVTNANVPINKNPGFTTRLTMENNKLYIEVLNLDNVLYIETLGIYLDSLCRIIEDGSKACNDLTMVSVNKSMPDATITNNKELSLNEQIMLAINAAKPDIQVDIPDNPLLNFDDDDEYEGGSKDDDSNDNAPIDNKKLNLLYRLKNADPVLFKEVNVKDGNKKERYTRTCPAMQQPVVISNEEKQNIDTNYKGSYEHAIQYGSDETKKNNNWYICPRFWCFKTNTSMTDADIKAGKCGKTKAEQDEYVFEFNNKKHNNLDGSYRYFNPSLIPKNDDNNYCMPCCYAEWDSKMHKKRRQQCMEGITNNDSKKVVSNEIMAHNKALTPGRWGYLPTSIQYFMQIKQKDDSVLFLRYGVATKQSLIACLADVYGRLYKMTTIPSVKDMREILVKSFTETDFVKFGNGSFTSTFKSLGSESAYKNFCKYLLHTEDELDYTYLWDIVCKPNPKLFIHGLNLIIMDIVNNDITDKVDLVCPTTSYVATRYDKQRDSLFLISTESRFEPVYLVFNPKKDKTVIPVFQQTKLKISNITNVLSTIDKTLNKYCSANRSANLKEPPEYYHTFKAPMELHTLLNELDNTPGYDVNQQILNYQDRVIGITVNTPSKHTIVVYSEPSAQIDDFTSVYMDDPSLWLDYSTTRDELIKLNNTNSKILCKPIVKVFENGLVVGFITQTNQFVKLSNPADDENDGIMSIKEKNYILNNSKQIPLAISQALDKSKGPDTKRTYAVRNVGLESDFYILYRATLKTLLENTDLRNNMISLLDNATWSYNEKLEKVATYVKEITNDAVQYASFTNNVLNNMTMVAYTCQDKLTSGVFKDGCKLIVPEKNLVSGKSNSTVYPYRVADELIRFGRIKNYILNSNQFLNMGNTEFKLNNDEYILLESMLFSKEYFEDMIPHKSVGIVHDVAKTNINSPPIVSLENQIEPVRQDNVVCAQTVLHRKNSNNNYWVLEVFPEKKKTMQIIYKNTPECSFEPLAHIMTQIRGTPVSVGDIKFMLWDAYKKLSPQELNAMKYMMKKQGKKQMLEKLDVDFEVVFKSESYYMTTADVWLFAETYEVPIILFSNSIYMHDVLIIQDSNDVEYNAKYSIYTLQKVEKYKDYTRSWILMGTAKPNSAYWFYESMREVRGGDEILNNVIIDKAYKIDDLGSHFRDELRDRNHIKLKDHLVKLMNIKK